MHLRREVAQVSPRQQVVFPYRPRIIHEDDIHFRFHAPVLESVVEQDEIHLRVFAADTGDAFRPLFAYGNDRRGMVAFYQFGLVAHIEKRSVRPDLQISFRPATVSPRKDGDRVVASQLLYQVLRHGSFTRSPHRDIADAHDRNIRPVTLYDTRIIEQVPYPQCECVQSGRYGAEKPHLMSYGFKRQSMRIFKVRPKARKNKVFHPYSEKIGRPPSGAPDRGHGAQHRSRHFPSEKRAARSKTLPTPNIRRPRPMNERFKTTRPLSGI